MSRWQPQSPDERFFSKVDASGDCWVWTGGLNPFGYGVFPRGSRDTSNVPAHRWCWQFLVGPIPAGMTLDHLCRNRRCVNPDHLEVVTRGQNVLRGFTSAALNARKTHCKNGHAFTADNTHVTKLGERRCRQCDREMKRAIRDQMIALGAPITERRAA